MTTAQQTMEAISQLAELPDNWDTYGSPTIRPAALKSASLVVSAMECENLPTPHVSPISGGGVGLTWQMGTRELLVELLPDGTAEYLAVWTHQDAGQEMEQEGDLSPLDCKIMRRMAAWLCGREVVPQF